tara:strand:+ start:283 stop:462 length:180 start_codon:yes stop_codon:yes gene_type:complete
MSKVSLLSSIEITMNSTLKRFHQISDADHITLKQEFKEWLVAIENGDNNYDVLYLNKIN